LFDKLGNEHTGSDGTKISCVGNIGALTGGSAFAFSASGALPLSNIRLIAISTFPSANVRYCWAIASLSPDTQDTYNSELTHMNSHVLLLLQHIFSGIATFKLIMRDERIALVYVLERMLPLHRIRSLIARFNLKGITKNEKDKPTYPSPR